MDCLAEVPVLCYLVLPALQVARYESELEAQVLALEGLSGEREAARVAVQVGPSTRSTQPHHTQLAAPHSPSLLHGPAVLSLCSSLELALTRHPLSPSLTDPHPRGPLPCCRRQHPVPQPWPVRWWRWRLSCCRCPGGGHEGWPPSQASPGIGALSSLPPLTLPPPHSPSHSPPSPQAKSARLRLEASAAEAGERAAAAERALGVG